MPPQKAAHTFFLLVWLERLWQDLRYGCRTLIASPGFSIIAILSLAIGIGANCAIFSFADALLLRPLPVARPGDVVTVGLCLRHRRVRCHAERRAEAEDGRAGQREPLPAARRRADDRPRLPRRR